MFVLAVQLFHTSSRWPRAAWAAQPGLGGERRPSCARSRRGSAPRSLATAAHPTAAGDQLKLRAIAGRKRRSRCTRCDPSGACAGACRKRPDRRPDTAKRLHGASPAHRRSGTNHRGARIGSLVALEITFLVAQMPALYSPNVPQHFPWPLRRSDPVALSRSDPPGARVSVATRARRGDGTASAVLTG
jgi:hypothetical protein